MTRFFWRIFLSTWAIAVITAVLALYVSEWLSNPAPALLPSTQVTEVVARDLRAALAQGVSDPSVIATRYAIDLAPMLEVFILDEDGNDVLGRHVPGAVFRAVVGEEYISWLPDDWLQATVVSEDLGGYTVVSYQGVYPLGEALADPKVRFFALVIALILSASISFLLAQFIIKPVTRLREAGHLVASGDLSARVLPAMGQRQDALADLARDFDVMTERVAESLATQRQLMRDVSHELRSPLARLQALVSVAEQRGDPSNSDFLQRLEGELERLDLLIGDILSFSKLQTQETVTRTRTDIVDLLRTIVDDAGIETEANQKPITLNSPEQLVIEVDHWLMQSAIENIVRNALRHTKENTAVAISVNESAGEATITVDDHGPGVPESALEAMFLPFYRIEDGRPTHTGSGGIGLAIAARAAALHGGVITAQNRDSGGLRVTLSVPLQAH